MSPYPVQTDRQTIIETARSLIERDGIQSLSLARLASALGVKAPSLYRYVRNKNDLLKATNEATLQDLMDTYNEAAQAGQTPSEKLARLAQAYREFAHKNPRTYLLAFSTREPELRPDPDELVEKVVPTQQILAEISGEERSLAALRGLLALVHGFVSLELNEQLQRGGDLSITFDQVVAAYLRGWN